MGCLGIGIGQILMLSACFMPWWWAASALAGVWALHLLDTLVRKGDRGANVFVYSVAMGGAACSALMIMAALAENGLADEVDAVPYAGLLVLGILLATADKPDALSTPAFRR
ncbi:hypothetical protein Sros01_67970 [Streptomyces roseochromogenus]|nr:hypothetical protein Sros01_67970 [Streptomyces roseochromogenus]